MALRQTIRSLTPLLLRSSNVNTSLPSSAVSHQSRAGLAYGRRSGQLPSGTPVDCVEGVRHRSCPDASVSLDLLNAYEARFL